VGGVFEPLHLTSALSRIRRTKLLVFLVKNEGRNQPGNQRSNEGVKFYFIGLNDEIRRLKQILSLNFIDYSLEDCSLEDVFGGKRGEGSYRFKKKLILARPFPIPLFDLGGKLEHSPLDTIVGVLADASDKAMFQIAITTAPSKIYSFCEEYYSYRRYGANSNERRRVGRSSDDEGEGSYKKIREKTRQANLFLCEIKIFANEVEDLAQIAKSFDQFPINTFKLLEGGGEEEDGGNNTLRKEELEDGDDHRHHHRCSSSSSFLMMIRKPNVVSTYIRKVISPLHSSTSPYNIVLTPQELSSLVGLPSSIERLPSSPGPHLVPPHFDVPLNDSKNSGNEITVLGEFNSNKYGIYPKERTHIAIFGQTGTGKTTLISNLIKQNIDLSEGFALFDPHGDFANEVLKKLIPNEKMERVIYFDPTTAIRYNRIVQINFLEYTSIEERGRVSEDLIDALKKMFSDFWGPRLEFILRNSILTLLEQPEGSVSLSDLYWLLSDEDRRRDFVKNVREPMVSSFWNNDFPNLARDSSMAVINKIAKLIQSPILSPIFSGKKSSIDLGKIMDNGYFLIVNLSKGNLTEDISKFLGTLLVSRIFTKAMARVELQIYERSPFYVYVDEAHNFTSLTINQILAEARKYKIMLTLATQYPSQYPTSIRDAVLNNSKTIITFRQGVEGAQDLLPVFHPWKQYDLMGLPDYTFAIKSIVRGKELKPFTLTTIIIPKEIEDSMDGGREETMMKRFETYSNPVEPRQLVVSPVRQTELEPPLTPLEARILYTLMVNEKMSSVELRVAVQKTTGAQFPDISTATRNLEGRDLVSTSVDVRLVAERGRRRVWRSVTPKARKLLDVDLAGARTGGDFHAALIIQRVKEIRKKGGWAFIDTGRTVGELKPDILAVYPKDANTWGERIAYEVETNPKGHPQRVVHNLTKNLPTKTCFIVTSESDKEFIEAMLSNDKSVVDVVVAGKLSSEKEEEDDDDEEEEGRDIDEEQEQLLLPEYSEDDEGMDEM
jgi:DNA helicase HerA-like ATPase/DNA-binding MarR family transcriptional regulator